MSNKTGGKGAFYLSKKKARLKQAENSPSPTKPRSRGKTLPKLKKVAAAAKHSTWSKAEDDCLRELVDIFSDTDDPKEIETWEEVEDQLPHGRNAVQCRDRWVSFLVPTRIIGNWTDEEVKTISDCYYSFGPRWASIAKLLPGRTDMDVKNKWNAMERQKIRRHKRLATDMKSEAESRVEKRSPSPTRKQPPRKKKRSLSPLKVAI